MVNSPSICQERMKYETLSRTEFKKDCQAHDSMVRNNGRLFSKGSLPPFN